jgi:hypothetical protein
MPELVASKESQVSMRSMQDILMEGVFTELCHLNPGG